MGDAREFLEKLEVKRNTNKILNDMKTPIATTNDGHHILIPNHSGEHTAGTTGTPVSDLDIANKKYVDDNAGGAPEGTAVKSSGEGAGTKFLREDGDGTCSWQTPAGSGNVSTSGSPIDNDFAKFVNATDIEGRSYSEVRTDLNVEDGADVTDVTNVTAAGAAMSGGAFHDGFSDFVANEHIDWTTDQGVTNIHANNYTDTNTQLSESDITTMGFTKDVEVDWTSSQSPAVIHADNYTDTNTTYVSSDFTHDSLSGVTANEHIDWTSDQGATNIDAGNYTDTGDTTAHASFSQLDYASAGHTGFAPALTGDQNYVTDDDITLLGNTSGTNTGDNAVNSNYSGLVSNVSTNLSLGTKTATTMNVNSSDGNNATLVEADTTNAGILGSDKWDEIVANTAKVSYPGSADSTELNILEGATLSTTEINYVKGVTSLIQTQLNAKVSYTKTNVKGHIAHGATASTARPTGFTSVEWVGSVEPTNAVNGDTWVDTA